jgi:hypothetical protein
MAATGILPAHWYYNTESGELTQGNNLENLGNNLLGGLGWHELDIPGSDTEAQAAAAAEKEFPTGKAPTTSLVKGAENTVPNVTGSLLGTLAGFLGLQSISGTNLVLRGVKIVIGSVLLISGIIHLSGVDRDALGVAKYAVLPSSFASKAAAVAE